MKVKGIKSGLASIAKCSRRSKNEIYFAELCQQLFHNVKTNDACFPSEHGNWDADVVLHHHKIAVMWNGVWHYKQVRKGHNVKQVQTRDRIKLIAIKASGYIPYVIKDMGRHNKRFVETQFELFKQFVEQLLTTRNH